MMSIHHDLECFWGNRATNISICRLQDCRQKTYTADSYTHMKSQSQNLPPQQCAMKDRTFYPLFLLSYEQPSEKLIEQKLKK